MAGKVKHLQHLNGRYYTRVVIPESLRHFFGNKAELRQPLGADRRAAERKHKIVLADFTHQIMQAERRAAHEQGIPQPAGRYPMSDQQIAYSSYLDRLEQDAQARKTSPVWAMVSVNDQLVDHLRAAIAGRASDSELNALVGHRLAHFRKVGNTDAKLGTPEWRSLAMALCAAEYEALGRMMERDEGDFSGQPAHPLLRDATPIEEEVPPVSLVGLFRDYIASRHALGKGYEAGKRWEPVFANLTKFVGHDDARKITKAEVRDWRDKLLQTLSPRTVSDTYLASVRTVYNWAIREDRLTENPVENVRQERPKKVQTRPKGYTDAEALRILTVSTAHVPALFMDGHTREFPETTAAKRWLPILCAMTGARVAEMAQLRKQDIRREGDRHVLRISPEAGTVKTGQFRDVPLHRQLIELGFLEFVEAAADGPLFYRSKDGKHDLRAARTISDRVGKWLKEQELVPKGVSPNHGWRHRFKTQARELNVSDRIADAICGHAGRTAGEDYGDVSITAKLRLIDQLPAYDLERK